MSKRGGRRAGAGRKPGASKLVRVVAYLPPDLAEWIEMGGGSRFVRELLDRARSARGRLAGSVLGVEGHHE